MGNYCHTQDPVTNRNFNFTICVVIGHVVVFKSPARVSKFIEYKPYFRTVLISILYALSRSVAPPGLINSRNIQRRCAAMCEREYNQISKLF